MRYTPIESSFFAKNRLNFCGLLEDNIIAILTSNDIKHTNADDVMGFAQNNDLFYLSGIDQFETILVLFPDAAREENREILFVKQRSEIEKIWDGHVFSKEKVTELSGINRIEWTADFEKIIQLMAFEADGFSLGHNEHIKRLTNNQLTRQDRMIKWCRQKYPLHNYYRAAKITRTLRTKKSEEELVMMRKAIAISVEGFKRILTAVQPNMMEYELEAELTYVNAKNGALRHAFKPIVASGVNACALHYNTNDSVCKDGEMILLDFGVCYGNYNSDTTRCIPVNGKFSERQKQVYESVLHCLKEGSKLLIPGITSLDYEVKMAKLVEQELVNLGLLSLEEIESQDPNKPLYKKYFMHGSAHHLGLDVHDVGLYSVPFEVGNVLTCEPGIYIPEEGIGCRLEDDFLLTENGNINLTAHLPIEIKEIEALIQNKK